jgi:hypothetical protein
VIGRRLDHGSLAEKAAHKGYGRPRRHPRDLERPKASVGPQQRGIRWAAATRRSLCSARGSARPRPLTRSRP